MMSTTATANFRPAMADFHDDEGDESEFEAELALAAERKRPKQPRVKRETDTLIISDVHLGSEVCRASELVETLKSWRFRRLILLGDIFDDLNFKRLRKSHWKVLSYLRKVAKRSEVIWVKGNHDAQFFDFIASLMGVEAHDEYAFHLGGKPILCVHGDRFDRILMQNPLMSVVAGRVYQIIQRFDGRRQRMSRFIKRSSKGWLKVSRKVAESALDYARKRGAQAIFCGHTHQAMTYEARGLSYYNTGCWTDIPATFATIDGRGEIEIHEVH